MDPGRTLPAETTAVLVSSLHWASKSLVELFVSWASEVEPDRGDVASWLSSTGRHLGEQAQSLAGLMPDSVLLADSTGLAAPAADDEPLDPASGAGGLDDEVQALAVAVPSGRSGADEGGRQGLVGMAALGLGLPWFPGGVRSSTHPHIIWGMESDYKGRRWLTVSVV